MKACGADRLSAVRAEVALARLDLQGRAAAGTADQDAARQVTRADRETTDPYARQAVIDAAADALVQAGLLDEAETLLKGELTRSHSPYYFMVDLAELAKKRGDKAGALDWYARSYAAAQGPATRVQWGVRYVNARIELAPQDIAGVERAAASVIGELDPVPDTFYGRNLESLERMGKRLTEWSKDPAQRAGVCTHSQPNGWRVREASRRRSGACDVFWRVASASGTCVSRQREANAPPAAVA